MQDALPFLYVWAELRIPAPMQSFLKSKDFLSYVWHKVELRLRQAGVKDVEEIDLHRLLLRTAGGLLLDFLSSIRMQILFAGGTNDPRQILDVPMPPLTILPTWGGDVPE